MSKQIPELTIITTPTAGQESIIETVVARHDTYATSRMTLAQIFTLGSISGSIKVALDALSGLISGNTSSINTLSSTKLNIAGGTRTGLTANRALITDASGVETFLTWGLTDFIWFDGSWMPVAKAPDGKITWEIRMWSTWTAPSGWSLCNWSAISRTTYATLFALIWTTYWVWDWSTTFNVPDLQGRIAVGKKASVSKGTATITIAAPWVVTFTWHALATGNKVYFTTTGSLPTGLAINTDYFVTVIDANTFNLSLTLWGASITTTGSQSGTHTLFSSDFNTIGWNGGEVNHTLGLTEMPTHNHDLIDQFGGSSSQNMVLSADGNWTTEKTYTTANKWSGLTHNNVQPYLTVSYIIAL